MRGQYRNSELGDTRVTLLAHLRDVRNNPGRRSGPVKTGPDELIDVPQLASTDEDTVDVGDASRRERREEELNVRSANNARVMYGPRKA